MKEFKCLQCSILFKRESHRTNKYCSNTCQKEYQYFTQVDSWLLGKELGYTGRTVQLKNFVKRWLFEERGAKCEECGWDKVHPSDGRPLVEVDHIDGDAKNCTPSNLKILCPNCHSMTPTFRNRNRESTRLR